MSQVSDLLSQAKSLHVAGRWREAQQQYASVLVSDPTHAEACYLLGAVERELGNVDQAIFHVRQAVRWNENYSAALHLLGSLLAQQGRLDEALKYLQAAARLEPANPEIAQNLRGTTAMQHESRGSELAEQGRLEEATHEFRQALELAPGYLAALGNLGNALKGLQRLDEAAACYQQILRIEPQLAQAHFDLGTLAEARQVPAEAAACYRRAVELEPQFAVAQASLGRVLASQGQLDQALACCRLAVQLAPELPVAHQALGTVLAKRGALGEAVSSFAHALLYEPYNAATHNLLGAALTDQGKFDEAAESYRRALEFDPNFAQAYYNLATTLLRQNRLEEARTCFERAIELNPNYYEAHSNLAVVFKQQRKLEQAVAGFRRAIQLNGRDATAHTNLGTVLAQQGFDLAYGFGQPAVAATDATADERYAQSQAKLDEAAASYRRAIELEPRSAESHHQLAILALVRKQVDQALTLCEQALALDPQSPEIRYTRASARLLTGRLAEGWPEYETRFQLREARPQHLDLPRWHGESLPGGTILLHCEQGLGDALQFVRYAPLVAERVGRVVLECPASLKALFARVAGVAEVVVAGEVLPKADVQVPLLSLPGIFGTTLDNVPAKVPYLSVDEKLVEQWRQALAGESAYKIGIAWQGNPEHPRDRIRSFALSRFAPLAQLAGVRLYSLQPGAGREQIAAVADAWPIEDLGERLGDFNNTAALLANLDLVISCDSSAAHLAGALGRPVWVPLALVPDWRWMLDREDSPWYPSMRLFRQPRVGDWDAVFRRMTRALEQRLANIKKTPSVSRESPDHFLD